MIWFKAKRYGWGWVPVTWQGWAVTLAYAVAMVKIFRSVDAGSHSGSDTLIGVAVPFVVLTCILLSICYTTGERPKWRWGGK